MTRGLGFGARLSTDRRAVVTERLRWIPVEKAAPPRGAKLLLINRRYGVAVIGEWTPGAGWTHWQGLPTFDRSGEA